MLLRVHFVKWPQIYKGVHSMSNFLLSKKNQLKKVIFCARSITFCNRCQNEFQKVVNMKLFPPLFCLMFLVACTRLYNPLCRSVRPSVRPSIRQSNFTFLVFFRSSPHCSCPNDQVTLDTAPAHPHATGVAVYPALFFHLSPISQ